MRTSHRSCVTSNVASRYGNIATMSLLSGRNAFWKLRLPLAFLASTNSAILIQSRAFRRFMRTFAIRSDGTLRLHFWMQFGKDRPSALSLIQSLIVLSSGASGR